MRPNENYTSTYRIAPAPNHVTPKRSDPPRIRSNRSRGRSRPTRGRFFWIHASDRRTGTRFNKDHSDMFVTPSQHESIFFGNSVKVDLSRYPIRPNLV